MNPPEPVPARINAASWHKDLGVLPPCRLSPATVRLHALCYISPPDSCSHWIPLLPPVLPASALSPVWSLSSLLYSPKHHRLKFSVWYRCSQKVANIREDDNLVKDKKLFQVKQESLPVLKDSWPTLSLEMSYWPDLLGVCSTGCHGARACSHSFLIREIPPPKLLSCLLLRIFSWSWWRLLTTLLPNIVWAFCTNHLLSNFSSSKKAYQSIVLCTRFYTLSKAKR